MQLPDIEIRPRSNWEALDLGTHLARRHLPLLMAAWAALTLPVFVLLSLVLWKYPSAAMLVFWWLKPLYERLPLFILSRAVFGEVPTVRQSLRALPGQLKLQWLASITWRRLSPTRSFDLPVIQLEGQSGAARTQRLGILGQRSSGVASWLTVVGYHLEMALIFGLMALFYMLLPQPLMDDWEWQDLISSDRWLGLEHLSNLLYVLVLTVWEPFYVACGFSLYLNRRTQLEGWDIELGFRRLRKRLLGSGTVAALLLVGLLGFAPPDAAWAKNRPEPSPTDERLLNQELTSSEAQQSIKQLLDNPPFENRKTVTNWRFPNSDEQKEPEPDPEESAGAVRQFLSKLFGALAPVAEVILWALLIAIVAVLLWRYREWLRLFAPRLAGKRKRPSAPKVMFGLAVAPETLPEDVASEAARLWAESPRQALGLLYRATLSHLLHALELPLKASHTEGEVLALLAPAEQAELYRYLKTLTGHWQALAYGHLTLPDEAGPQLCEGYRQVIDRRAAA